MLRLQKFIADQGVCSRRKAEDMIREGQVRVNGKVATLGQKVDPESDHVKVAGKLLRSTSPHKIVVAFFKPRGVLSSKARKEHENVETSFDFLTKLKKYNLMPVGRLDRDTEGLLLLTNDGKLANRLNLTKYEVPKIYKVKIDGQLEDKKKKRLESRPLIEGKRLRDVKVIPMRKTQGKQWLKIETTEAQNRIVRKLFEHVGHPVDKIRRVRFANIQLGSMIRGQWRIIDNKELEDLREWVGLAD